MLGAFFMDQQSIQTILLKHFFFLFIVSFSFEEAKSNTTFKPVDMQCEYLYNPLGIDAQQPRLSWKLEDVRSGAKQSAYQIVVSKDSNNFSAPQFLVWQTGKVNEAITLVQYRGKPLQPFTKYYWTVYL